MDTFLASKTTEIPFDSWAQLMALGSAYRKPCHRPDQKNLLLGTSCRGFRLPLAMQKA